MGRSITCTHRLVMEGGDFGQFMGWDTRGQWGKPRPSNAALRQFLEDLVESTCAGGPNNHIAKALGRACRLPERAYIVAQTGSRAGEVVAEYYRDDVNA